MAVSMRNRFSTVPKGKFSLKGFGPTRTKQEFKDECDVNLIIAKFNKTGLLPSLQRKEPRFGDFSDVPSYQDSLNRVMFAQEQFSALPAAVRKACGNNPAIFLAKVHDPEFLAAHADSIGSPALVAKIAAAAIAAAAPGPGVADPSISTPPVKGAKISKASPSSD